MRLQSSFGVEEDGSLICSVYRVRAPSWNDQHLYSLRLMKLNGNEFRLNNGRFYHFTLLPQQYRIVLRHVGILTHVSASIIEWIAENVNTPWSMKFIPLPIESCNQPELEFSFDDSTAAGFFALRWR